ncbi:unnamed protein product [Oncorhynchus mykiss]|uniref:Kinesin motor domain-containing protein n=1 Tax=Oncorhynchus mykiss TaxID=8022 RepID=A0A060YMC7_ONCMY|nr:unnamed protein product [Oncorhynchus mykiss]
MIESYQNSILYTITCIVTVKCVCTLFLIFLDSVLSGYNGTIFAYGQTGSGKTFTITGGAERYSDRGIIPRTLSYLYQHFSQDSSMVYTTHISYLEIYNEVGYDLLDPRHEASRLEDLPSVPPSFLYFTLIRLAHLKKSSSDF